MTQMRDRIRILLVVGAMLVSASVAAFGTGDGGGTVQAAASAAGHDDAALDPRARIPAGVPIEDILQAAGPLWHHHIMSQRTATALAETGEPRNLAVAALILEIIGDRNEAKCPADAEAARDVERWRREALAGAGQDITALALIALGKGCPAAMAQRHEAVTRWQALEPGNLTPWFRDEAAGMQILRRIDQFDRVESHRFAQARAFGDALLDPRVPRDDMWSEMPADASAGDLAIIDAWSALATGFVSLSANWEPGFAVVSPCRAAKPAAPDRPACLKLGRLLASRSDTLLDQLYGDSILRGIADSAEEVAEADARALNRSWQSFQWSQHGAEVRLPLERRIYSDPAITTEIEANHAINAALGVDETPPPGWKPPFN